MNTNLVSMSSDPFPFSPDLSLVSALRVPVLSDAYPVSGLHSPVFVLRSPVFVLRSPVFPDLVSILGGFIPM
jgi:hypothetical protein